MVFQSEGAELYQALEGITDHHMKDGLVSLMSVATDFTRYCAYELHNAMDVSLINISVTVKITYYIHSARTCEGRLVSRETYILINLFQGRCIY